MAGGFECSLLELDIIGEALRLDTRPFPFDFPVHGDTMPERGRLAEVVERGLAGRGLTRDAGFAPVVARLVGLFAAARWSVAMLGTAGRRGFCVRAGSDGQRAVLAVRQGDWVRFDPVTPASIVRTVVDLLPRMRTGPGGSVTVSLGDVSSASPSRPDAVPESFLERVSPLPSPSGAQQGIIEAVLRRPRSGAGYFVATVRGRNGRESQPSTLNWIDTDAGRYVMVPDGRGYVTCAPADLARVEQHLVRLVNELD